MKRYERIENRLFGVGKYVLMLVALCTVACSDDTSDNDGRGGKLQLLSYSKPFQEAPASRTVTVPASYVPFADIYPDATTSFPRIGVYLMAGTEGSLHSFQYLADGTWKSNAIVKEPNYYIYGFMPTMSSMQTSIAPIGAATDYVNGATLTLQGVPSLTLEDPCVTVGILGVTSPTADANVQLGNFAYTTQEEGHNYVYMLFDHLYAGIRFSIRVDEQYSRLRTIHLKSLKLQTGVQGKANINVTLVPNSNPISNVTYTLSTGAPGVDLSLYTDTGTGKVLTTTYESVGQMACYAPGIRNNLKLVTEYDVYDRKGNLVREGCVAENLLSSNLPNLTRGQRRTVRLTVNPTYLYQLSEPELDNPTISITE